MTVNRKVLFPVAGAILLAGVPVMIDKGPAEVAAALAEWLPLFYVAAVLLAIYAAYEFGRHAGRKAAPAGDGEAAKRAGLLRSYANREEARADIVAAVESAAFIKIMSNKGDEWLSATGLIVAPLTERAAKGERVPVKLLLLHLNAPWLLGRAVDKGFWRRERAQVAADFSAGHKRVAECKPTPEVEPAHFHRQDPSWRFLMTDRALFMQTYATNAQINEGTVLQFSSRSPIYASAARHFDYLYELDSAEQDQISPLESLRQKKLEHEVSAGLILTRDSPGGRSVLVLWKDGRYWLPKGGMEPGEEPLDTARRELLEETGASAPPGGEKFVKAVMVGQPFSDAVSLKTIMFYHRHLAAGGNAIVPNAYARWADAQQLGQWTPRYEYVPELLALIGLNGIG